MRREKTLPRGIEVLIEQFADDAIFDGNVKNAAFLTDTN